MSSEKYIGMDVHQATISVAVLDSQGKTLMECILETKASTLLEFVGGLRGTLYVTFEEGTWAAWLYDLLKPHVAKVVVCNPRKNALLKHGSKSDKIDAHKLADRLRLNDLKPVYHEESGVRMLRELARSYLTIVKDLTRVMSRVKAVYRSWGIPWGPGGLLHPPSPAVVEQDPGTWSAPASRATVSATRHVAALASTSPPRATRGEPEAHHYRQTTDDTVDRSHSLRLGGSADSDSQSLSHEAPAVDL
jgi:hypothetical protein